MVGVTGTTRGTSGKYLAYSTASAHILIIFTGILLAIVE